MALEALARWDRPEHGLQGRHLALEITESAAVLPTQLLESTLTALRAEGISIAVDDFGTGYSSLSYLRRLPARQLKIDRSFVQDVATQEDAQAIVRAVIKLAHALGLKVVAWWMTGSVALLSDALSEAGYSVLVATNFEGADLRGTSLVETVYHSTTRWPDGFDPQAHGATRVP